MFLYLKHPQKLRHNMQQSSVSHGCITPAFVFSDMKLGGSGAGRDPVPKPEIESQFLESPPLSIVTMPTELSRHLHV
jgi:hypothetical protein